MKIQHLIMKFMFIISFFCMLLSTTLAANLPTATIKGTSANTMPPDEISPPAGSRFWLNDLVLSSNGQTMYAVDEVNCIIAVTNTTDGSVIKRIKLPVPATRCRKLALTPDDKTLYAKGAATIFKVTLSNDVIEEKNIVTVLGGFAIPPIGDQLYVAEFATVGESTYIYVLDQKTLQIITKIPKNPPQLFPPLGFTQIGISTDSKFAYLLDPRNLSIATLDLTTNQLKLYAIMLFDVATSLAVDSNGLTLYVISASGTLYSIDLAKNRVTNKVHLTMSPGGVAVTPDSKKVYVTNTISNTVSVIDATSFVVSNNIAVGDTPTSVKTSMDGTKAYVGNAASGTVSVVDVKTDKIMQEFKIFN
ncbi:MAG TPA: YncE family protein [Gammaproteobacteria bacterium]|nr:YncE family protein [Gammaproteobacteria bacterium]